MAPAILFTSVLLSLAFAVYGLNTLYLTLAARKYRTQSAPLPANRPRVAIHLPIYNEFYVVGRLLDSCVHAAKDYGSELVGIYVLDDSTDETSSEIDRIVSNYSSQGYQMKVVRRGSRRGFKAGALQAGLSETAEKYVAVLDADFVLPSGFLERTVAILEANPDVGFVQAKWGHLDRGHNVVTQSLAIGVDAHFLLEQTGRNGNGFLMNFNGSAGVLRASAIREAGGWASDTLAEDLDLSYRLQLRGYRGVYLNDLEVPGELPPTIAGMKRQQGRWARGSIQAAKKLMGKISRSDKLSVRQKVEAGIHLTYYMVHPLMVASFLLAVAATFLSVDVIRYAVDISIPATFFMGGAGGAMMMVQVVPWVVFSTLVVLSTFSVVLYCIQAIRVQRLGLIENVREIILLVVLGYGISISNSVQALGGLFSQRTGTFSRTPKYAIEGRGQTWEGKKYQISSRGTMALELSAAVLAGAAFVYGVVTSNFGILPVLAVYLLGYSFVLYLTLYQEIKSKGTPDR
jgi:cellulose synthase/poly-beta-1,6-N-acetylglucosamine synthase-like glycosyltransferase